ncbi:PHD finger protein 14 isoform X4 [Tachypleus tridentatus]|uniref:PHD finger protein 14 isoform X3 n=1 Tax=Tachypleus tridentatus TaxID=6853 RepID=UPI003FD3F66E
MERDPGKRRVKPVEKHLQMLDFGDLDDSSDDSDFKIGEHEHEGGSDDGGDTSASSEEESKSEEEVEKKVEQTPIPAPTATQPPQNEVPDHSVGELIEKAMQRQSQARQRISGEGSSSRIKVLICSVCLGDISQEEDEIVECDFCGVSVHEGCYGISDTDTVVSTVSSSSTEPWFCDACKAGNMNPVCELCPNQGGIFKETDVGRWVHLVCALYIPGVAFGDVDKLTPVTLFEMPYSRWGAKACGLCEDERFSRTGVSISCDAGMCRNYFHVTCAQREGLLSEASTEESIADPFFAYCKLHGDKNIARSKRCNWLALQSQAKDKRHEDKPPSDEKARVERKLAWHREKYLATKAKKPPAWVPTQKMPRLLTTSPAACKKLLKKAEMLGMSPQTYLTNSDTMVNIRKKWHIQPAFSVEFISYYLDRNNRMVSMQRHLDELLQQNSKLQEEEQNVRQKYEQLLEEAEELKKINFELTEKGIEFWKILCETGNKKLPLPEVLKPKPIVKSPSKSNRKSDSSSVFFDRCGICHQSKDQHQLAKCDSCQLHYHLYCLDPPLTRMPKKTKSQGWQCSECDKTEEDDHEEEVDPNAPRKLRDHVKGPTKFNPVNKPALVERRVMRRGRQQRQLRVSADSVDSFAGEETETSMDVSDTKDSTQSAEETENTASSSPSKQVSKQKLNIRRRRGGLRVSAKRKAEVLMSETEDKLEEPLRIVTRLSSTPTRKAAEKDLRTDCVRCGESGSNTNLVRCDECKNCFHFHCLVPPVKKSPKPRGYTWFCEDCDQTEGQEGSNHVTEETKTKVEIETST